MGTPSGQEARPSGLVHDHRGIAVHHADALTALRALPDCSVHAVITDPPYGLADHRAEVVTAALIAWASGDRERVPDGRGFMGRRWDAFVPPPAVWDEALRVLVPGGHLAVFAGSRTADLMGLSIRLAGFDMRDGIAAWLYGSGFPKSLDIGKAIDKAAGATREVVGEKVYSGGHVQRSNGTDLGRMNDDGWKPTDGRADTAPATDAAREWQGWGTALKPAHEPILLARKPLAGTVAANVLAHRAGGINIDACRVDAETDDPRGMRRSQRGTTQSWEGGAFSGERTNGSDGGRWPTNVVLAHHPDCGPDEAPGPCVDGCQVAALDTQSGGLRARGNVTPTKRNPDTSRVTYSPFNGGTGTVDPGDTGGASRFFPTFRYCAKAPKRERPIVDGRGHPTVKPLDLMRWLVRLLVPAHDGQAGMVIDPFAGSGSTLEAARLEGVRAIGIERDDDHIPLILQRLGVTPIREGRPAVDHRALTVDDDSEQVGLFAALD